LPWQSIPNVLFLPEFTFQHDFLIAMVVFEHDPDSIALAESKAG
jgi:hypothetical protein